VKLLPLPHTSVGALLNAKAEQGQGCLTPKYRTSIELCPVMMMWPPDSLKYMAKTVVGAEKVTTWTPSASKTATTTSEIEGSMIKMGQAAIAISSWCPGARTTESRHVELIETWIRAGFEVGIPDTTGLAFGDFETDRIRSARDDTVAVGATNGDSVRALDVVEVSFSFGFGDCEAASSCDVAARGDSLFVADAAARGDIETVGIGDGNTDRDSIWVQDAAGRSVSVGFDDGETVVS
jgi:hypothetical protein